MILLPLSTVTKIVDNVSLSPTDSTSVDFQALLGLSSAITIQLNPPAADGLVVKLMGSLDASNYNIFLAEVGSDYNFTNKLFGPLKSFRATVTNYGSVSRNATVYAAIAA